MRAIAPRKSKRCEKYPLENTAATRSSSSHPRLQRMTRERLWYWVTLLECAIGRNPESSVSGYIVRGFQVPRVRRGDEIVFATMQFEPVDLPVS